MKKKQIQWFLAVLILMLNGCQTSSPQPSPTSSIKPTLILPTKTVTPTQQLLFTPTITVTQTPSLRLTTTPTSTSTPKPGPNIDLVLMKAGVIYRYNLQTMLSKRLDLSSSDILEVTISPDMKFIAFTDANGLHISERPFTQLISSIPTVGNAWGLVFSNDNHLAYVDQEGLKIYNLQNEAVTLLKSHFRDSLDETNNYYYSPGDWSPDSQWLWINISGFEWSSKILSNVITGVDKHYTACYWYIDWLQDSRAFVASVIYSGYEVCGEDGGVNVVTVSGNDLSEEQVFSERGEGVLDHESRYTAWDPLGEKILFVQTSINNESKDRLLLLDYATKQIQELDKSEDEIMTPKWSEDGDKVYYIIQTVEESQLVRLDLRTSEKQVISHLVKDVRIMVVISQDDWLLLSIHFSRKPDSLLIINAASGEQIDLSNVTPFTDIEQFIGITPGQ